MEGSSRRHWATASVGAVVAAGLLYIGAPAAADWTSIGPFGGSINALAVDPQTPTTLYAGTSRGVYKSTDGGTSWRAVNTGLTDLNVQALMRDVGSKATCRQSVHPHRP